MNQNVIIFCTINLGVMLFACCSFQFFFPVDESGAMSLKWHELPVQKADILPKHAYLAFRQNLFNCKGTRKLRTSLIFINLLFLMERPTRNLKSNPKELSTGKPYTYWNLQSPGFTAKFAVQLNGNLCRDTHQHLLLADGAAHYNLRRN